MTQIENQKPESVKSNNPCQSVIQTGYKQTEVGVIPEDWVVLPLYELGKFKNGINKNSEAFGHGSPFVNLMDVFGVSSISTSDSLGLVETNNTEQQLYDLREGDVIFIRSSVKPSGVGLTAVVEKNLPKTVFSGFLIRFRDSGAMDTGFKRHCFYGDNFRGSVIAASSVSANTNINQDNLKKLMLPLPPTKAEQEAIAEALSDTDALIEALEQLITKKRHLKQGAMQELLTGKKRLPGFSGEWEVKQLGSLAGITRGASPRPIDSPIWFDENSTIGWVRISDVTKSGMFLCETTQRLSPLGVKSSRPVSRGSLIMSICATIGRPIITEIDVCIHDGFVVFDAPCVNQLFLYYALKSIEGDWSKHGQTGSQMNLNTGLINRTKISVPRDEAEQTAIVTILSDMDAEITTLETKLAKTRQLKQGIMHNLLTGKIRLVPPPHV